MPLYSDSNYYYIGGSSQLYSPYYPTTPTSNSYSVPYSSTYNRMIGGSYSMPLSSLSRPPSSTYTTSHGLSSRYQPKLTTITESSPLIGSSSRHHGIMPLTRIQSPKFSTYSTPSTSTTTLNSTRYIPPRPISINTADIDVSASRYRKHKEAEVQKAAKKKEASKSNSTTPSPSGSTKRGSKEKPKDTLTPTVTPESTDRSRPAARSTIRRNRPVVRLSMIRANSKDLSNDINESSENKFHDLPRVPDFVQENIGWRQRLAEDLASIPAFPIRKSPGDLIRERYLIQEEKPAVVEVPKRDVIKIPGIPQTIEQVVVELDPLHHTIRRLSLPQCPSFHDICEDISSDKIDDDLNAGELRRRASLLQEQEQEILNQLQQSGSGTFQLIHLERRGSHDSQPDETLLIGGKPKHKKSKKIRHKITATVDFENPVQMPVLVERDEDAVTPALKTGTPKPKFTFNVDSVEEHDEVNKIFKLPKKKIIKKTTTKTKATEEVEPKAAQNFVSTAEIFTFSQKSIEANEAQMANVETPKTPKFDKQNIENINLPKSKAATPTDSPKPKNAIFASRQKIEKSAISAKSIETAMDSTKPKNATLSSKEKISKFEMSKSTKSEETSVNPPKPDVAVLSTSEIVENKEKIEIIDIVDATKVHTTHIESPNPLNATLTNCEAEEKPLLKQTIKTIASKATKSTKTPVQSAKPINATISDKEKLENIEIPVSTKKNVAPIDTPKPVNAILSTVQQQEKKLKTPSPPKDAPMPSSLTLTTSASLELSSKRKSPTLSSTLPKSKSFQAISNETSNSKSTPKEQKAPLLEDTTTPSQTGIFQSTVSLDIGYNLRPKEISKEPGIATPKPIRKGVQKSESGEDFWAQIGSRETIYMEIRKKSLHEIQWKPVEEDDTENESKTSREKTLLTPEKTTPTKQKEEKLIKKVTPKKKTSPTLSKGTEAMKTPSENMATTCNEKEIPEDVQLIAPKMTEASTGIKTTIGEKTTATTATAATSPKINIGQEAKSPENRTASEAYSFTAAETSDRTSINNAFTSAGATTTEDANVSTPPVSETITAITTTTTTTSHITPQTPPSIEKHLQPEANRVKKVTEGTKPEKKCTDDPKSTIDTEKAKLPLAKPKVTAKSSIAPESSPSSGATPLNADQFIMVAPPPAKTAAPKTIAATSPKINKAKKIPSPAKSNQQKIKTAAIISDKTLTATKTTTTTAETTIKTTTTNVATATSSTTITAALQTTTTETATATASVAENASAAKIAIKSGDSKKESSSNLAKFATVSDLAQCLLDVDADIEDYYSSSAELSDGDSNLSDISSPDDCENLSASMKKKLKLKKKKERKAEKAQFDPQKKIKIDVKNKCYVKEEKPRFPLVATPRPLWRREKIEYPDDDTDSEESESDTGSNAETTEDSEECTTSEEYEDDLGIVASGGTPVATKVSVIRMSTCSNDSGFEGGTAPSSPKKMLETSHTYSEFQKSGRFTEPATVIPKFKNYCVDDFHFLAVLGKGSFGKVLLAELRGTTYYYAVKCLKKDVVLEDDDVDSTLIERKVLALGTKHPYLCHLFCTFQTESHLFFVMEYLNGGDLMFHIQESGRFTEERARFYGAEIISGLKFLHKKGIIYRDLKLDNVLLDYEGHVRIADFGMCKLQIYLDKTADSFCGTPDYMAPEIIKGEKYNQNVDWWSFGVLLYEMLIGQSPFSGCDEDELFWSICNEIPWFPVYISSEALSILKGLLEKDYTKRIGTHYSPAGDVKDHKFFRPIDWSLLEKRELKPPFRPQVKHPLDTQYFDRVFTKERVCLTPIDRDILQSMDQKQFLGFTYTNPHIALD